MSAKILIIDDEPLVRRSLLRALSSAGYVVLEAKDGSEGLQYWQKEQPQIVFLDVLMPGLSGPEVLSQISMSVRRNCYVILISAYSGGYNLESAKELGADLFIPKPFEDIFAIVEKVNQIATAVSKK